MLRVLKPGGTIAFSTWPPELFVGRECEAISADYFEDNAVQQGYLITRAVKR